MADTDRELLELAAKAVGEHPISLATSPYKSWNPLGDDGDALRLAVKLELFNLLHLLSIYGDPELYKRDPYAATRRAIVRAAAEIGRAM